MDDDLYAALSYAENDSKTDRKMYVSGINCSKQNAYAEMVAVQRRFGMRGKVVGYHGIQSFAAGEVTPEQAFEIGKVTARKMWGDRYQVLVTVHLNTDNVHCHFVVNPVSYKDGVKFKNKIGDHKELRRVSDEICREHGLSVLENSNFYGGHKKDYWRHKSGKKTHRDYLREDVEYCLSFATSPREFENQLYALGYKWAIFKNVHEPIIDRETFEQVQNFIGKTRRRNPKPENWERNMFCDLLYCADCGKKLWFNIKHDKEDIPFFMCGNYHGNRGTCSSTHYLRADAIEQVVTLELRRLSKCLCDDEESFAALLASKTNADILKEKKHIEGELQKCIVRSEQVSELCIKCYEDNVSGKLSDEMFMRFSNKYETERLDLKEKISAYRKRLSEVDEMQLGKEKFMAAVRKFMQMDKLTAPLLQELIDRIDVYEVTGTGKNRKQQIKIHYKFVGYLELPSLARQHNYREETRKGVAVEYVPNALPA